MVPLCCACVCGYMYNMHEDVCALLYSIYVCICIYFVIPVTIFAYGQTSSGKTYTIRGEEGKPGLISLAINDICKAINEVNVTLRKHTLTFNNYSRIKCY